MASFFYAMVRLLRLRRSLVATVMHPNHFELEKTPRMHRACIDVKNEDMWNAFYVLCALCHGPLLVLRYSDAGEPAMDKVFYWSYRTCIYIKEHEDEINEAAFFAGDGGLEADGNFDEEIRMFFSGSDKRYGVCWIIFLMFVTHFKIIVASASETGRLYDAVEDDDDSFVGRASLQK